MSLFDAKIELQNIPRLPPVSWYFAEAAAVLSLAAILVEVAGA
jgi:hypothetical protein